VAGADYEAGHQDLWGREIHLPVQNLKVGPAAWGKGRGGGTVLKISSPLVGRVKFWVLSYFFDPIVYPEQVSWHVD